MPHAQSQEFVRYYTKLRSRTKSLLACIPPESIEWAYADGKYTFGDTIRHMAALERYMWAENCQGKPSAYTGCGIDLAEGYDNVIAYMDGMHEESIAIFSALTDQDMQRKCTTPAGIQITTWKWLRAMTEHEIHHRAQLYVYLGILGVETPPLYGLKAEQVADRAGQ
jgi:uncharacterized damage-inducible protein DinB